MACAARFALFAVLAACKHEEPAPVDPEISGVFTIDGKPMTLTECHPSAIAGDVAVQLTTQTGGRLRFRASEMEFQFQAQKWELLPCDRLKHDWAGAVRADGTAYGQGTLDFQCKWLDLVMAGNLTLDCGHVTAEERRSLDKKRAESLRESAPSAP